MTNDDGASWRLHQPLEKYDRIDLALRMSAVRLLAGDMNAAVRLAEMADRFAAADAEAQA